MNDTDNITWDMDMHGNSINITLSDKDIVGASIFTKYPDLESKSVKEGLGIDVVQGLRKIINESQ